MRLGLCVASLTLITVACGARSELEVGRALESDEGGAGGAGGEGTTTQGTGAGTTQSSVASTTQGVGGSAGGSSVGCADGEREGFVDVERFPGVAGCAGGFQVPGVAGAPPPQCGRVAGDDSTNPAGLGCSAEDLCAEGFTLCPSDAAFTRCAAAACADATSEPGVFFISGQTGTGCGLCANGSSTDQACEFCACASGCAPSPTINNDLFGCGTAGLPTTGCGAFDRFSDDQCGALPAPWACLGDSCGEALSVTKPGPGAGGVLCCRNDCLD